MLYHEAQPLRPGHVRVVLAMPPAALLFMAIRQMVFHHPWTHPPMSDGGLLFLTVLLWAVYLRLITVRLVTDLDRHELSVGLKGLWRKTNLPVSEIRSATPVRYDPAADFGGYGIRSGPRGVAYIASGNGGVQLELRDGRKILVGSQYPEALARSITESKPGGEAGKS